MKQMNPVRRAGAALFLCFCFLSVLRGRAAADFSLDPVHWTGIDDEDYSVGNGPEVVREYTLIPGEPAPENPVTHAQTPDEFNVIPVFRFRLDTGAEPPRPVRAVVIIQAGFMAGANQMFHIARSLVSLSDGDVEVWVPERRHTLLEDQWGMDEAETTHNPHLAYSYYLDRDEVEGHQYQPLDTHGAESDMMSEWGLDLWLKDMRRVVELVPEEHRSTGVFIAGDSRGVAFVQAFAAYEFDDGLLGNDMIAGMILWDGGLRPDNSLNAFTYTQRVANIRSGAASRTIPMDEDTYWFMEVFGMVTTPGAGDPHDPTVGPAGFFPTYGPFEAVHDFLTRGKAITMTNEAFFGLVLDGDSIPYPKFMGHLGRITGGPVRKGLLGEYPTDTGSVYHWKRYDRCDPVEWVDVRKLARMLWEGPSDFTDLWYSARLDLDLHAAYPYESTGTWTDLYFHLYTTQVDAPVFAMVSLNYYGEGLMESYRDALPPVRGHSSPRTQYGFVLIEKPEWSHLDGIAVEIPYNTVFPKLLAWLGRWSGESFQVPEF